MPHCKTRACEVLSSISSYCVHILEPRCHTTIKCSSYLKPPPTPRVSRTYLNRSLRSYSRRISIRRRGRNKKQRPNLLPFYQTSIPFDHVPPALLPPRRSRPSVARASFGLIRLASLRLASRRLDLG